MSFDLDTLLKHPSNGYKDLINCILSENKEQFIHHWIEWKQHQDFENLEGDSMLLFPLLYDKIEKYAVVDENLPRYKGIIKKNWVFSTKNQTYLNQIKACLLEEQIPFLLYGDYVLNTITTDFNYPIKSNTISILVNQKDFMRSIKILTSLGCKKSIKSKIKEVFLGRNYTSFELKNTKVILYKRPLSIPLKSQGLCNLIVNSSCENFIQDNITLYLYYMIIRSQTEFSTPKTNWIIYPFLMEKQYKIDWNLFIDLTLKDNTKFIILPAYKLLHHLDPLKFPTFVKDKLVDSKTSWWNNLEYYFATHKKSVLQQILRLSYYFFKGLLLKIG